MSPMIKCWDCGLVCLHMIIFHWNWTVFFFRLLMLLLSIYFTLWLYTISGVYAHWLMLGLNGLKHICVVGLFKKCPVPSQRVTTLERVEPVSGYRNEIPQKHAVGLHLWYSPTEWPINWYGWMLVFSNVYLFCGNENVIRFHLHAM